MRVGLQKFVYNIRVHSDLGNEWRLRVLYAAVMRLYRFLPSEVMKGDAPARLLLVYEAKHRSPCVNVRLSPTIQLCIARLL